MTSSGKNVPTLRFRDFDQEWNHVSIQDLIDKKSILSHLDGNHGALYPRSEEFTTTGVPYISANDFYNGKVRFSNCKRLPNDRASQFKKGIAKDGDVLFAHNATVGPTALLETDLSYVILSTTATYFRCDNKNLLNKFLKLFFETGYFIRQYSRVMSQSTRNQVPITTQRTFTVGVPQFREQQKIASFFSAVDEKIQQLTRKKELLEQYKRGVTQQLFSGKLRFNEKKGKTYPKWQKMQVGSFLNIKSGFGFKASEYSVNGVPLLQIENVTYGCVKWNSNTIFLPNSYLDKYPDLHLKEGNIVLALNRPVTNNSLKIAKLKKGDVPAILYQRVGKLCINQNLIISDFAYQLFVRDVKEFVLREAIGSDQPFISIKSLYKLELLIPCIEEQQKIAICLSSIDTKIEGVSSQISQIHTFKKGLLQQLFV